MKITHTRITNAKLRKMTATKVGYTETKLHRRAEKLSQMSAWVQKTLERVQRERNRRQEAQSMVKVNGIDYRVVKRSQDRLVLRVI